jgi:PKD repeat protein
VEGETVTFTGTVAAGDPPIEYTWDFGDGGMGSGPNMTHVFTPAGEYTIWMTATNCGGTGQDVISYTLTVTEEVEPCEPVTGADFAWSPQEPVEGETVTFTGTVTAGDPPIEYTWDFGDGEAGSGPNATHVFTPAGEYTVWMTATNCGGTGQGVISYTLTVTEEVPPCEPVAGADFAWSPQEPVEGETVTLTGTVAAGDLPIEYTWDFGGGGMGSGLNVTHVFTPAGDYTVWMTATNCGGASADVMSYTLTITEEMPSPPEYFVYLPTIVKGRSD